MPKYQALNIDVFGKAVPVRLYREWRSSIRFSIGKKYVIIRVPVLVGDLSLKQNLNKLSDWVADKAKSDPTILKRLVPGTFMDGQVIPILRDSYTLKLDSEERDNFSGRISDGLIVIKVPNKVAGEIRDKSIREIVIKLLNKAYLPYIKQKVHQINEQHFHEKIEGVRLKYNTSNWGSCSSKRNINLSSRLLLTNEKVLDYVIVHELAHLKEMNHSPRFWKIVEKVMPDYKQQEEWLSTQGKMCYL